MMRDLRGFLRALDVSPISRYLVHLPLSPLDKAVMDVATMRPSAHHVGKGVASAAAPHPLSPVHGSHAAHETQAGGRNMNSGPKNLDKSVAALP